MASKYISKLQGQRVLILGGTSGTGFCVAEAAIEHGATVIIAGSKQSKLDNKLSELQEFYPAARGRIFGKTCDLSDLRDQESNILALLDFATEEKTKKLNHIVNTTGDGLNNPPFSELTVDIIYKSQTVRMIAPLMLAKHAEKYLHKLPSSSLTFTGGAGILKPIPGWTLMPIIGGMLNSLVLSLAVNIAPIRVNVVSPGQVLTELWGGGQKLSEEKAAAVAESNKARVLTGQIGKPEDLAEVYIQLVKNHFITGQNIVSDGGLLLK